MMAEFFVGPRQGQSGDDDYKNMLLFTCFSPSSQLLFGGRKVLHRGVKAAAMQSLVSDLMQ